LEEQASQGSFVTHERQDVLTTAIRRPEHPGRVCAPGAGVMIKQYFGPAPRTSTMSSSMAPEDLEQLTQKIRDQLEELITEKVTRQLMLSFSQMQFQFQLQMQSQGLVLPPKPEVGPSTSCVSTKESCVDPSGNDPDMGDSDKCRLYVEENHPCLVALGRLYEGSTTVHNIPLLHDQVKVGVEEVRDADALIPVPTEEVKLVGHTLKTFLAWCSPQLTVHFFFFSFLFETRKWGCMCYRQAHRIVKYFKLKQSNPSIEHRDVWIRQRFVQESDIV